MTDLRDEFIARVARGRSFADVGGLWEIVNEKISVAARSEAYPLTMVDVAEPDDELWGRLSDRLSSIGVANCEFISSDITALSSTGRAFDVVHCSGVLYHHPNPLALLESLRRVTGRHLILTSAVTQETVSNDLGSYRIPASGVVFVPALNEKERGILSKYWRESAGVGACYGITDTVEWDTKDFVPWWWLPTAPAMIAMVRSAGFRVVEDGPTWNGNAHTVLLEVVT